MYIAKQKHLLLTGETITCVVTCVVNKFNRIKIRDERRILEDSFEDGKVLVNSQIAHFAVCIVKLRKLTRGWVVDT